MRFQKYKILMVAFVVIVSTGIAFAMSNKPEIYSFRYKMTVEVETPEGVKTGSVVREVTVAIQPVPMDKRRPWRSTMRVKGEAVVVDLGQRGILFALLDGDDAHHVVFDTFPYEFGGGTPQGASYYAQLKAGPSPVKHIPTMVTFKDIKDPKSVTEFSRDDLSATFGTGVELKGVNIEMTDEPITKMIDEYLTNQFWDGFDRWWSVLDLDKKSTKAFLFNNFKIGS